MALIVNTFLNHGDTVLIDDPTYRGTLDLLNQVGSRMVGIPVLRGPPDPARITTQISQAAALYCQTGVHNPTGRTPLYREVLALAGLATSTGLLTIEDRSSSDLTLHGSFSPISLAHVTDPELVLTVGTTTELFWSVIRIGWVRGTPARIALLARALALHQMACSSVDQALMLELLPYIDEARRERRQLLQELLLHGTWG